MAYGWRHLGPRTPHSSRGRHDPPRTAGKPLTGRRGSAPTSARACLLTTARRGGSVEFTAPREVREMRSAETLLGLLRERGSQRLPVERVYRLLFNPTLYLMAYG